MNAINIVRSPYTGFFFNSIYAVSNCVVGFMVHSWWFITVGAYYAVLAATRFSVLQINKNTRGTIDIDRFVKRITGILLVCYLFAW